MTARIDVTKYLTSGLGRAMLTLSSEVASTVEPALFELVKIRASQLNGCAYCIDMLGERQRSAVHRNHSTPSERHQTVDLVGDLERAIVDSRERACGRHVETDRQHVGTVESGNRLRLRRVAAEVRPVDGDLVRADVRHDGKSLARRRRAGVKLRLRRIELPCTRTSTRTH